MQHRWNTKTSIILLQADTKKRRGLQFVRVVSATDEQSINLQRTRHYNAKINMEAECNFDEVNLESMRPVQRSSWQICMKRWVAAESCPSMCDRRGSVLGCVICQFSALPTHLGSQAKASTGLGKYFHWSLFSVMVPVGGALQGWFLTEPPGCALYFREASTNLWWHQCARSSSFSDE